jgi:hypothetical protein
MRHEEGPTRDTDEFDHPSKENLELGEIAMFLEFVYVSILGAVELAEGLVPTKDPSAH